MIGCELANLKHGGDRKSDQVSKQKLDSMTLSEAAALVGISSNDKRRHMSKGARAMVAAKICKLNLQTTREAGESIQTSHTYISHASVVLEYAPDLVDAVISGCLAAVSWELLDNVKTQGGSHFSGFARERFGLTHSTASYWVKIGRTRKNFV